jgi:hypothetical protein
VFGLPFAEGMMPQSAGDKEATLDLSDIDIQQARTIHEAMEQKLSPEEGECLPFPPRFRCLLLS